MMFVGTHLHLDTAALVVAYACQSVVPGGLCFSIQLLLEVGNVPVEKQTDYPDQARRDADMTALGAHLREERQRDAALQVRDPFGENAHGYST